MTKNSEGLNALEHLRQNKNLDGIISLLKFVDKRPKADSDTFYIEQSIPALSPEIDDNFNLHCGGCVFSWLSWFWSDKEKDNQPMLCNTVSMTSRHFRNKKEIDAAYAKMTIRKQMECVKVPAQTHDFMYGWHKTVEYLLGISTPAKIGILTRQLTECGAPFIPYGYDKWRTSPYKVFQELRKRHKEYAGK